MRLRTKLAVFITLLTCLLYGIGGTLLILFSFQRSLEREKEQALQSYRFLQSTLTLINSISEQYYSNEIGNLLIQELNSSDSDWEALRFYTDTTVYQTKGNFSYDDSLKELCTDTACALKTYHNSMGHFLQITGTFSVNHTVFYLDAVQNISEIYELREAQLQIYRSLFLILIVLSGILSFLIAHFLTKPLHRLSIVSGEIAAGALEKRANVQGNDETASLASDFNHMAEILTTKIKEQQETIEQQERFIGSFTHEIKTPMTSLIGYADLLRSCTLSKEEQAECANYIFKEGKRLEQLSFQLLDLLVVRKKDFPMVSSAPADILQRALSVFRRSFAAQNILIDVETEDGCCLLAPDLVQSLLLNLLDNAGKAIDSNGSIRIRQSMLTDGCRYEVIDNGRGIPKEDLEKLTEAFYRVDKSRSRKQGGAGLGLSICKEIVELHHGTLSITSEPGLGTKVIVELRGNRV